MRHELVWKMLRKQKRRRKSRVKSDINSKNSFYLLALMNISPTHHHHLISRALEINLYICALHSFSSFYRISLFSPLSHYNTTILLNMPLYPIPLKVLQLFHFILWMIPDSSISFAYNFLSPLFKQLLPTYLCL